MLNAYWVTRTGLSVLLVSGSMCVLTSVTVTTNSIATARTPSAPAPASAPGLVVIDASGDPIAFNAAAAEILCYPDKIKNPLRASLVSRMNHALDHLAHDPSSL